ncbi:hypothetical protein RRF57_001279 [Xylaria bambusicola]|uniref:Uncharacterized protein n=1 Tax=Xylaria bambusicola TaxID=326684 RepID=A0AAN7UC61_9PEZI
MSWSELAPFIGAPFVLVSLSTNSAPELVGDNGTSKPRCALTWISDGNRPPVWDLPWNESWRELGTETEGSAEKGMSSSSSTTPSLLTLRWEERE